MKLHTHAHNDWLHSCLSVSEWINCLPLRTLRMTHKQRTDGRTCPQNSDKCNAFRATCSTIHVDTNRTPKSRWYSNHIKQLWFVDSMTNNVKQSCTMYTGNLTGSIPERSPQSFCFAVKLGFNSVCTSNLRIGGVAIHLQSVITSNPIHTNTTPEHCTFFYYYY